jgi:hypothetical protein
MVGARSRERLVRGLFAAGRAQDLHRGTDTVDTAPCVVRELLAAVTVAGPLG